MNRLQQIVTQMKGLRIAVIGDAMNDVYHHGSTPRICPEAPALVFVEDREEVTDGGAANVAHNLSALEVETVTAFAPRWEWSSKHRYMVGHHLLMRFDKDRVCSRPEEIDVLTAINGWHSAGFPGANAVIVSDYAKGVVTKELMQVVVEECLERKILLVVDPKRSDWNLYAGAQWICPNEAELAASTGGIEFFSILAKRGALGCTLHEQHAIRGRVLTDIPAFPHQVFDVTGAGDVVVAVFTAALAAGALSQEAATLAMLAAGWSVGCVGTAACSAATLHHLAGLLSGWEPRAAIDAPRGLLS